MRSPAHENVKYSRHRRREKSSSPAARDLYYARWGAYTAERSGLIVECDREIESHYKTGPRAG